MARTTTDMRMFWEEEDDIHAHRLCWSRLLGSSRLEPGRANLMPAKQMGLIK